MTASASPTSTATNVTVAPSPKMTQVIQQRGDIQLQGIDIASVLRSTGPVVKCVVLRAPRSPKEDEQEALSSSSSSSSNVNGILLMKHLVEEIELDTTPRQNEVAKLLGGPFTFVGQYEEEGIMVMARLGCVGQDATVGVDNGENEESKMCVNPHKLQPPFDQTTVYGDILLLKVAEVADPLDDDDDDERNTDEAESSRTPTVEVAPNDEFFLDYTKEAYLKFAARTDVVPPQVPLDAIHEAAAGTESDEDDDGDEEDGEWSGEEEEDEEEISEEEGQAGMMNLILSAVLKKFFEDNGREPDTDELLVLRMTVAHKLGMSLPGVEEGEDSEDENEDGEENNDSFDNEQGVAVAEEASDSNDKMTTKRTHDQHTHDKEGDSVETKNTIEEPLEKRVKSDESHKMVAILSQ
jgi:hypothetical protein